MLRGEFHCGDGLVIPNNITVFGAQTLLAAALCNTVPSFWVGLVDGVPDSGLQIEDLDEPEIGVNGYERVEIERSTGGWPTTGLTNGEPYIESGWLTWVATGGNFSKAIRRMVLLSTEDEVTGNIFALSAVLPDLRLIGPDTPLAQRRFKYRIYLR